jgi:hypothetical protein
MLADPDEELKVKRSRSNADKKLAEIEQTSACFEC